MTSVTEGHVAPQKQHQQQQGDTTKPPAMDQDHRVDDPIQSLELFSAETVEQLSNGFLAVLEPELLHVQKSLNELITNQEEMLDSIHDKTSQFEDSSDLSSEIQTTLQQVPVYKQKLVHISKQMQTISKKVKRLQQRANKLKEIRQARDVQRKKDYERKLQHEKMLEARPAK